MIVISGADLTKKTFGLDVFGDVDPLGVKPSFPELSLSVRKQSTTSLSAIAHRADLIDFMLPAFSSAARDGEIKEFLVAVVEQWVIHFPVDLLFRLPGVLYFRYRDNILELESLAREADTSANRALLQKVCVCTNHSIVAHSRPSIAFIIPAQAQSKDTTGPGF